MRKERHLFKLIIVSLFLIQFNSLFSQNDSATPTYGVKAGALFSTLTGDEAIDKYAKKIGPQIGLTGAYYFHPMFSIRSELNYELKGGKFSNHDMKMNLHYASLPLYFKFNFTKDPEIYIYLGGYVSYLFMANSKGTYEIIIGDEFSTESVNEDILPNMSKLDAGVLGGFGAQGRYNRWIDVFIDLRYTRGFINVDNQKAELRYNFNLEPFWPEQNLDKPMNKAFMFTTGIIVYLDPR